VSPIGSICVIAKRAGVGLAPLSTSVPVIRKRGYGSTVSGKFTSAMPTAAIASISFLPELRSALYWEGDRNPAVCGVAVGAFDTSAFPPPSDSIWEESMYPWLGLPPRMEHPSRADHRPNEANKRRERLE